MVGCGVIEACGESDIMRIISSTRGSNIHGYCGGVCGGNDDCVCGGGGVVVVGTQGRR